MAELSYIEKRTIEDHFIQQGWVLDFSDKSFQDFIGDVTGIDISNPKYSKDNSGSKGNKLRAFIKLEADYTVGKLLSALHDYLVKYQVKKGTVLSFNHYNDLVKIYTRLLGGSVIEHIDAIQANNDDKDFHQLARLIKESIEKNEPEAALDRLHTFLLKFFKELCNSHGVEFKKEDPVNVIYGIYIRAVRSKNLIESEMAAKIINSTFQVFQAFNDIRNNRSFAHDNPILNYEESVLIFSNVTATLKFIQSIEAKRENILITEAKPDWGQF